MESKPEGPINYLPFVDCTLDAAKQHVYLYIKPKNKPPKIINYTSIDVTFGGACTRRLVEKQHGSHSTAPADKQINE